MIGYAIMLENGSKIMYYCTTIEAAHVASVGP